MKIWVDADACPTPIKEILFKAATRTKTQVSLVANKTLRIPPSSLITFQLVPKGQDVADSYIAEQMRPGDLVITGDIPLAADILRNKGYAVNPRGQVYTKENIAERLATRDFMDSLRADGIDTGGPPPISKRDIQQFANALDRLLTRYTPSHQ